MPVGRFFVDSSLEGSQSVVVDGKEFVHLAKVMRTKEGERVELVNGKGYMARACVMKIKKSCAILDIEDVAMYDKPLRSIILVQAMPRFGRLDYILEKGTELGMTEIWLFPADHSEKTKFSDNQLRRMELITIASMKQCGRLYIPKIVVKPPLCKWDSLVMTAFFGDVEKGAPRLIDSWTPTKEVMFFVGPEAGFSENEVLLLREKGVKGVWLHDNILRTDTAPLVALSIICQMS